LASDRATIMSPFTRRMLSAGEPLRLDSFAHNGFRSGLNAYRSLAGIISTTCLIAPNRNGLPSFESSAFQKSTASRTAGNRESPSDDTTTIEGISFHGHWEATRLCRDWA